MRLILKVFLSSQESNEAYLTKSTDINTAKPYHMFNLLLKTAHG